MWSKWTQHLSSPQDREEFRKSLRLSAPILERVVEILDERERSLDTTEFAMDTFDNPSWAYLQASIIGRRSELREIKRLLTLDQRKELTND